MPPYPHLAEDKVDIGNTARKLRAMRTVGVPYSTDEIHAASDAAMRDGRLIAAELEKTGGVQLAPDSKLVALIAYLQRLGLSQSPAAPVEPAPQTVAATGPGAPAHAEVP
jgi:cytochrome c oxidase cbb3-type subunit I/II